MLECVLAFCEQRFDMERDIESSSGVDEPGSMNSDLGRSSHNPCLDSFGRHGRKLDTQSETSNASKTHNTRSYVV